ncbi:hypothetical protein [Xenorhabdus bovienii]|uniref:Uncharacterized protein n=1 Tax=Xenorhabdus bovienii str. kraussei Becker Underwood TaxID=1398204 RepID=A0A077PWV2_XENBV|nr:hypothetical protein [Xenorhabdus bovienii]CDH24369.1 hypothetical protein XBKB1_2670020 [Xenorhabdus bovienii str. kraussei Becker Underwood]
MESPQHSIDEALKDLIEKLNKKQSINDFEYFRLLQQAKKGNALINTLTEGVVNIVYGKIDDGLSIIKPYIFAGDLYYATLYSQSLFAFHKAEELLNVIFKLSDQYNSSKLLSFQAYSVATNIGNIELMDKYMDRHLSLLSQDEGKDDALTLAESHDRDIHKIYEMNLCSQEQFKRLFLYTEGILNTYPRMPTKHAICSDDDLGYLVELEGVASKVIVEMNNLLAEKVCSDEEMDSCELIARFAYLAPNWKGQFYAYN